MHYSNAVPISGNVVRALDVAIASLTSVGFRIVAKNNSSVDLAGPGMFSTRQSPLIGDSRAQLSADPNELSVHAELGGVQWMSRFILLFPAGLSLVLFLVLVGVFSFTMPQSLALAAGIAGAATGTNAVIWLLLVPPLTRYIQARSCRALDALVGNMAEVGRDA